ncbi:MAG: hypothetical protein MI743_17550 [Sneathiellales bacterium]|nr:hypothetical protein [Sneathiellales bacterium]
MIKTNRILAYAVISILSLSGCASSVPSSSSSGQEKQTVSGGDYGISSEKSSLLTKIASSAVNETVFANDAAFGGSVSATVLRIYTSGNLQECRMFAVKSATINLSNQTFYSCKTGGQWELIGREYRN